MGKSSWVPFILRVYFSPVTDDMFYSGCCKYCLLLAGDEDLDRWTRSLLVILSKLLLWTWLLSGNVFELMKLRIELCSFHETNSVCIILFQTLMDVIRMPHVNCCNEWCVVLNHYDLGLYFGSYLKYFKIFGLLGLWEPKYRNLITSVIFFYLRSYNLVGSVTPIVLYDLSWIEYGLLQKFMEARGAMALYGPNVASPLL
jgi:hypothetical protein